MKKVWQIVLLLLIVCLISSIVINIVVIKELISVKLMDYDEIGLTALIDGNITEMYVDEGNNPNLQGVFSDTETVENLFNIIENGCYQKCPNITFDSAPGSGSYPFIRLKTSDHTYAIAIIGDKVCISIDGTDQCYYSNIRYKIQNLINDALHKYFSE